MATSILSKRWKLLWSLVPKIEINKLELFCESADHFSRFLDLHKAPYLRTCRITYDFADCCSNLVDTWVNHVAAREVEELDLVINRDNDEWKPLELPHRVYYCKTLVVLKLLGRIMIDPPPSFQFPSLKKLGLFRLAYKSDSFFRLLSGCPILEDLSFEREYSEGVNHYKICVPTLKRLSIFQYDFDQFDYDNEINPDDELNYKLEINAPAIEYFQFNGHLGDIIFLKELDNLVHADINICTFEAGEHGEEECYADRVFKLLDALYNAKFLSFSSGYSKVSSFILFFLIFKEIFILLQISGPKLKV